MILELVFIRSGDFKFSDSRDSICPCLKLNLLFSLFVLANLYHFLLCALRVRAHSKYKYSTQTSGSKTTTTLSTFFLHRTSDNLSRFFSAPLVLMSTKTNHQSYLRTTKSSDQREVETISRI